VPGERALEVLEGRRTPAAPRDAATVMLLRPQSDSGPPGMSSGGIEVYMLRRKATMAFAPGAFVFPGGSVDARDADQQVGWAGPDPAEWGQLLGAPPELARALVCAAVRETFEESGVLLAGPAAGSAVPARGGDPPEPPVVADTTGEAWEADRRALLDRSLSLAGLLRQRGLVLRSDLLRPWSRWITPVVEERRYDTRFFAAALPGQQRTRDVGGEADEVTWVRPADAIAMGRRREIMLMPPTAVTLAELAACPGVAAAVTADRQVRPLQPEVSVAAGTVWLAMPAGLEYPL
jgi:8-oxo-dGTP pyrophosphatase MutT (NUDIX family)